MMSTSEDQASGEIPLSLEETELDLSVLINSDDISTRIRDCYLKWESLREKHWDAGVRQTNATEMFWPKQQKCILWET